MSILCAPPPPRHAAPHTHQVYDGSSASATLLATLSGTTLPATVRTTGQNMFLKVQCVLLLRAIAPPLPPPHPTQPTGTATAGRPRS